MALRDHPRHLVLGAVVAGLLAGPHAPALASPPAAALVAVLAALGLGVAARGSGVSRRVARAVAVALVVVPLAAWGAAARLRALDSTVLHGWTGHAAVLRAVALGPPRPRSFGRWVILARVSAGPGAGERVLVAVSGVPSVGVGQEFLVRGGFRELPAHEQAARRAGAHALLRADSVASTGRRRGGVLGAIDRIRDRAESALAGGLPPALGALARGMVLGEDDRLPPVMAEEFRASGLAHLVAASGANVALLATLVLGLGALAGVPRLPRLIGALVLVAAYVPLAGGGPSIQRAGVMGIATLVAALASRPASRWYALLLAAAVTLVANPRAAQDPGWQLSFVAVVALLLLVAPLRSALGTRLPRPLADALAVCLAAALATAPLIALHFGRLSWVTVPANLLAVPAVAPVMWLGTGAAALGQLSPALAAPLVAAAAWPLGFVAWVGHAAASLPGAQLRMHLPPGAALAWWAVLGLLAVPRVRGRLGRAARRHLATRARRALAAGATVATLGTIAVAGAARPARPPGLTVAALDVGQGDATLVTDRGRAVLIDAGPPDGGVVDRLHEAGVARLDVLVITHAQADHEGGAAAVLAALPVAVVLDGRDGVHSPDGDRFAAAARSRGVRLVTPAAGQRLRAGPIVLDVLSPRPESPALHAGTDPNRRAIVAEVRDGAFSMLLTADAESDVLAALPLAPVDVLKVAHHGSDDPGLPALLTRLRPTVALIEVGRHNTYGHPAPATLTALAVVSHVYRTDRDGTVVIHPRS